MKKAIDEYTNKFNSNDIKPEIAYNVIKYYQHTRSLDLLKNICNFNIHVKSNIDRILNRQKKLYLCMKSGGISEINYYDLASKFCLKLSSSDTEKEVMVKNFKMLPKFNTFSLRSMNIKTISNRKIRTLLMFEGNTKIALCYKKGVMINLLSIDGKQLGSLEGSGDVYRLVEMGSNMIASTNTVQTLSLWDTERLSLIKSFILGNDQTFRSKVIISLDIETVLLGNNKGEINIWNTTCGNKIIDPFVVCENKLTTALKLTNKLLIGSNNGEIIYVNTNFTTLKNNKNQGQIKLFENSNSSKVPIYESTYKSGEVKLSIISKLDYHKSSICNIISLKADSIDDVKYASSCKEGLINIWTVEKLIYSFHAHNSQVYSIIFDPIYKILLTSSESEIKFWDVESRKLIYFTNASSLSKAYKIKYAILE